MKSAVNIVVERIKKEASGFCNVFYQSFLKGNTFAFWGLLVVFLNFILVHANGFTSDLFYWQNWVETLKSGVGNFKGDYPPAYVLWLRLVAAFYSATGLSMDLLYELKFYCMFPVIIAHLSLTHFVWLRLQKRTWSSQLKSVVMLLVVANPAFYLDGPIWGQVDVLPVTICIWALWYAAKPKTFALGIALFMLGLLTKFQMIMFLPVFGALALRYRKIMWKGLFSAAVVFGLVFLPFILAGNFTKEFSQAYMSSVGQYPYAAMNAGNLWMMISGNMTPDTRPIFEWAPAFLNPGLLGKILFVIVSFAVLVVCFIRRLSVGSLMMMASLNALAFFMLLPCMHERYVLAAAAMCICAIACQKKPNICAAVIVSGIAFLNISMMMSIRGDSLWFWISVGGIVGMVYFLCQVFAPGKLEVLFEKMRKIPVPGIVPCVVVVVVYAFSAGSTLAALDKMAYTLKDGESFVYDHPNLVNEQGYGKTQIGLSIDSNPLKLKGNIYVAGIGTHSPSRHVYKLPENATRFTALCGVDDESGNGLIEFIVLLDGKEIWRSGRLEGRQVAEVDVDITGGKTISLITDEVGSKNFDHADWVNPVIHTQK